MALLVLLSTTSWKVEKHYCMGRLMDVAFFESAENCGMDMGFDDADNADNISKMSCCDDEVILVEGQDNLKTSLEDFNLESQIFLTAFTNSYINLFEGITYIAIPHEKYPPPILVYDLQLLDQAFLI